MNKVKYKIELQNVTEWSLSCIFVYNFHTETAIGGVLQKNLFLNISQYSHENSCVGGFGL